VNIALVILHADPARGGAERYTIDLAAALIARGHEVSLLANSFDPHAPGKHVVLEANGATRRGRYLSFLDSLDQHLRNQIYDIVHTMLPVRRCDVYHPHAGAGRGCGGCRSRKYDGLRRSLAALGNRFNRKRQMFAKVERRLLGGNDAPIVLCLSEYVKKTVRKHYSLAEEKLATLFNAVDLAEVLTRRPGRRRGRRCGANFMSTMARWLA